MAVTPYQEKKYVQSDAVTQAQQALQNQQAQKPGQYQSQFQAGLDNLMGQIQNRPGFQYDVNGDALYQQVAQNYLQQGKQAMMDTMGQAAALTGGYGNSYAQTAGQQMYNQHLLGLTEMVPQFQQMALQQYQMENDRLMDQYSLMLQQEESAYARYQDDLNRYYAELDRLQGAYDSERDYDYNRFTDERVFDYGKYMDELNHQYQIDRDKVADDQWLQQLQRQMERDRIADQQWKQELAYQQDRDKIADDQWLQELQRQQERDKIADQQWQQELAYQQEQDRTAYEQWLQQLAYQQDRDRIAQEQWQKEYDEMVRQYNEDMAWNREQAEMEAAAAAAAASYDDDDSWYYYEEDYRNDDDEAYMLYQQAVSQGYGSTNAKNALKEAGYSDKAINSAMNTYEEKVIKPLSKPVKTKHGTM